MSDTRNGGPGRPPDARRALALVRACMEATGEALDKAAAFGFSDRGQVESAAAAKGAGFRRYQDYDYVVHRLEEAASLVAELASDERALALVAGSMPAGVADLRWAAALPERLRDGGPQAVHEAVWRDCPQLLRALVAAEEVLAGEASGRGVRYEAPRRGRRPRG